MQYPDQSPAFGCVEVDGDNNQAFNPAVCSTAEYWYRYSTATDGETDAGDWYNGARSMAISSADFWRYRFVYLKFTLDRVYSDIAGMCGHASQLLPCPAHARAYEACTPPPQTHMHTHTL